MSVQSLCCAHCSHGLNWSVTVEGIGVWGNEICCVMTCLQSYSIDLCFLPYCWSLIFIAWGPFNMGLLTVMNCLAIAPCLTWLGVNLSEINIVISWMTDRAGIVQVLFWKRVCATHTSYSQDTENDDLQWILKGSTDVYSYPCSQLGLLTLIFNAVRVFSCFWSCTLL